LRLKSPPDPRLQQCVLVSSLAQTFSLSIFLLCDDSQVRQPDMPVQLSSGDTDTPPLTSAYETEPSTKFSTPHPPFRCRDFRSSFGSISMFFRAFQAGLGIPYDVGRSFTSFPPLPLFPSLYVLLKIILKRIVYHTPFPRLVVPEVTVMYPSLCGDVFVTPSPPFRPDFLSSHPPSLVPANP